MHNRSALSIMFCTCFFIFLALLPSLRWCMYIPAQNVLLPFGSQVRERLLYTDNQRHGLFLQMNPDGSVTDSPVERQTCVLELRSVSPGQTVITSTATSLFLCVDDQDNLRGQRRYVKGDCTFQELLLADGYSYFLSPHSNVPVSLPRHGAPLSRFLPVMSSLAGRAEHEQIRESKQYSHDINLDSDDPFGHQSHIETLFSPSLHTK